MSGHSKWSSIKHKKSKEDIKRGQIFSKLARMITVAAKKGGGNPETNAALETAIEKAKSYNMPSDTIERAIKKGTGEVSGVSYEEMVYEGYGPNGVAILVEAMTDNRNRTASEIRNIFNRHGGNLGEPGSVSWMFKKVGQIIVAKEVEEETLMLVALEAGAEDINEEADHWEVIVEPSQLNELRRAFEKEGIPFTNVEISMLPQNVIKLEREQARRVLKLVEALEEHDDTQEVYANFDISDEILEELAAS